MEVRDVEGEEALGVVRVLARVAPAPALAELEHAAARNYRQRMAQLAAASVALLAEYCGVPDIDAGVNEGGDLLYFLCSRCTGASKRADNPQRPSLPPRAPGRTCLGISSFWQVR